MSPELSESAMLVPTAANSGELQDQALFDQLEAALDATFGGFTRCNDLIGSWRPPCLSSVRGQRELVIEYRIASAAAADIFAIAVWTGNRFNQHAIYVRLPSGRVVLLAPRLFRTDPVVRRRTDYALPAEAVVNLLRLPAHRAFNGPQILSFAAFDEELHEIPLTLTPIKLAASPARTSGGRAVLSSFGTRLEWMEAIQPIQATVDAFIDERVGDFALDSSRSSTAFFRRDQPFITDRDWTDSLPHAM